MNTLFKAMLLVLLVASVSQATVIYSEDFEGATGPSTRLKAEPWFWLSDYATVGHPAREVYVTDQTLLDPDGHAIDDSTLNGTLAGFNSPNSVDIGPTGALPIYTVEADLWVTSDTSLNQTFEIATIDETEVPLIIVRYINTAAGWQIYLNGFTGNAADNLVSGDSTSGVDEVMHLAIQLNLATDIVSVTLTPSATGNVITKSASFADGAESQIGVIGITQQFAEDPPHSFGGMDVDNILITEDIPEPMTLGLLAFGGVLGLLRRR